MIIIFDFDGVLFDIRRFKADYGTLFKRFGISEEIYSDTYRAARAETGGLYAPHVQLRYLKRMVPTLDVIGLRRALDRFAGGSRRYVFPDARAYLLDLRHRKIRCVVVSSGMGSQEKKITASGLCVFFDKIYVVRSLAKSGTIQKVLRRYKNERAIFIDDTKEVVEEVKKAIPLLYVVHMSRYGDPTSPYVNAAVSNFKEFNRVVNPVT